VVKSYPQTSQNRSSIGTNEEQFGQGLSVAEPDGSIGMATVGDRLGSDAGAAVIGSPQTSQ